MDRLASLVQVIGNRFVTSVFNVRSVFFEAGVKNTSSFTDVELSALGTMSDVCNVVCQADELLRDVHLGLWPVTLVSVCANEKTCSTFSVPPLHDCMARSGPWCSCGCRLTQPFRSSHQPHATDVNVVAFISDQLSVADSVKIAANSAA